jgi:predicted DNA-binding protein
MSKPKDRTGTRVNLTLPPEVVATFDRMSAVTGAGRASIIREILIESDSGFRDMATALEMAHAKNLDGFKMLAKSLDDSVKQSQQLSLEIKRTSRRMRRKKSP